MLSPVYLDTVFDEVFVRQVQPTVDDLGTDWSAPSKWPISVEIANCLLSIVQWRNGSHAVKREQTAIAPIATHGEWETGHPETLA